MTRVAAGRHDDGGRPAGGGEPSSCVISCMGLGARGGPSRPNMPVSLRLLLVVAMLVTGATAVRLHYLVPGGDLQAELNAGHLPDVPRVFVLGHGIHTAARAPLTLRDGDTLRGEAGAVLIGGLNLTGRTGVRVEGINVSSDRYMYPNPSSAICMYHLPCT